MTTKKETEVRVADNPAVETAKEHEPPLAAKENDALSGPADVPNPSRLLG